ncbi:hypothetical protein [Streptomyces sp. 1222.5]|uniref:hypothetical protein n=1 Tax=Streptomyces sp. 1222.5 TaxID=1881026 RepID=UPI003D755E2B
MMLLVVTIPPVEEVAAEPGTLDHLTASLRARIAERFDEPVKATQLGSLMGWPLVPDPKLPPGFVYLRPARRPVGQPAGEVQP